MRKLMLLSCLMAAMLTNLSAYAVDIGKCGTPEAMTAKFKAEGQRSFAYADHVTKEGLWHAMIFTTNADKSV